MGIRSVTDHPADKINDEVFAEQMLAFIRAEPALITMDDFREIERAIVTDDNGVTRRCALAIFTKPGSVLLDGVKKDDAAIGLAEVMQRLPGYIGHLETLLDLMNKANAWLMIALATREDMDGILAMAEKPEVSHA